MAHTEDKNSSQSPNNDKYTTCSSSDNESDEYDDVSCFHESTCYYTSSDEFVTSETSLSEIDNNENDNVIDINELIVNHDGIENDEHSMELLEENNNDPNNNMDNENNDLTDDIVDEELPLSPQPGCSNVTDLIENNFNKLNVNVIAQQIMECISMITHESIVGALNRAQIDGNKKQINLIELLPLSQGELNCKNVDYKCSMKRKNKTVDCSTAVPLLSPIRAGSFIERVFVDLTNTDDNSGQSNVISNDCLQSSMIDVESNSSIDIPSTSNENYIDKSSSVNSCHHTKIISKFPDPESCHRKIYISDYHSDNGEECKVFKLESSKTMSNCQSQTNKHSNSIATAIDIDKYFDNSRKQNKQEFMSIKSPRKFYSDGCNYSDYQGENLDTTRLMSHSSLPKTPTTNNIYYKRKYIDSSVSQCSDIATKKCYSVNSQIQDCQYTEINDIKMINNSNVSTNITANHHHEYHKHLNQTEFECKNK